MKGEIIAVGTELLMGNTTNTNAKYISQKMNELGIDVHYQIVVGDNLDRVADVIVKSLKRCDVLIVTGGLGPTDDDLTKEALSKAVGLELVPDEASLKRITDFFKSVNRPMAKCNNKQAYIPKGSKALLNHNGTAPGIHLEKDNKIIILLPGPPKEMIPMFENLVFPYLSNKSNAIIFSRTLRVVGIGESSIQEKIGDLFAKQSNPTIAPYAKSGEVHLRITCKEEKKEEAIIKINKLERIVKDILDEHVYGYDDDCLEKVVNDLLQTNNLKIGTAESCTGGLISQRLTSVSGASKSFECGFITYSNESKCKQLGVKIDTLIEYGAVSSKTACEMAEGVRAKSGADIGVSVTGIAGPEGGTEEKPVGLCFIGISYKDKTISYRQNFIGNREKIRWSCSTKVLDIIRKLLLNEFD